MKLMPGYKTYLSAAAIFIVGGLQALQLLDDETARTIKTMLEGLGLIALRLAIYKLE